MTERPSKQLVVTGSAMFDNLCYPTEVHFALGRKDWCEMADALSNKIIDRLRSIPDWANSQISLRELIGGITNKNFVADIDGKQYVVRIPGERTDVLGINRVNESEAAQRAAQLAIAPLVIGELPGFNTLITEFVDGRHLSGIEFNARLPEVIKLIKQFHNSEPIRGVFPIHRIVEAHVRDAQANGVAPPKLWESLHAVSIQIESAFNKTANVQVPCHNDLLPTNVLFGESRTWLIDFEYAGMNNAYFDLGNLSVNSELDEANDEILLTNYFGSVSRQMWAKLQLMKIMSELREGLWAVVQQAISTLDTDFVSYSETRLEHCNRLATSPNYVRLLDQAINE